MLYIFYIESVNQPELVFRKVALSSNALITKFVETVCDSFGIKMKNVLDYELKNDTVRISSTQLENMPLFKKKKFGFDHIFQDHAECTLTIRHTMGFFIEMQIILVEKDESKQAMPMIIQSKGRLSMMVKQ